ncbi:hypothetical protein ABID96_002626 [Bacillus sp. OAE603]
MEQHLAENFILLPGTILSTRVVINTFSYVLVFGVRLFYEAMENLISIFNSCFNYKFSYITNERIS